MLWSGSPGGCQAQSQEGETMKQRLTLSIGIALAMAILSSGGMARDAHAALQVPSTSDHTVRVMSQNMFREGPDSTPAPNATQFSALQAYVARILQESKDTNI